MTEDAELLQRYAEKRSEESFAELVRRHLPLVYAAALRQVDGAVHRAEDVTQTVFIELARNARPLSRRTEIVGWLYTTTHHAAAKLKRGEQRRQNREQEAHIMQEISSPSAADIEWERLRPVLDEAMHELNDLDRDAILMRFFQARRFADVGRALGLNEDAARMRVERAMEKLRAALARREITSTTAALAIVLANQPVVAASATLAATVTGAAMAGSGAAASAGAWMTLMSMTKLHVGITSALAVAGATGFALQAQSNAQLRAEVTRLRQDNAAIVSLREENLQLARTAADAAEMRHDDARLSTLNDEAVALRDRLEQVARAEQAQAARASGAADTVDVSKLDQSPRPKNQVRPSYPIELRDIGVGGEVLIEFTVDVDGDVRDAKAVNVATDNDALSANAARNVIRLIPFMVMAGPNDSTVAQDAVNAASNSMKAARIASLFESAALDAVSQWNFAAGTKGGRAVTTRMQVPIVFAVGNEGTSGTSRATTPGLAP